jgi:hypothetical protein
MGFKVFIKIFIIRIISNINAILCVIASFACYYFTEDLFSNPYYTNNEITCFSFSIVFGYFINDFFVLFRLGKKKILLL